MNRWRRLTPGRVKRAIAGRADLISRRNLPEVESAAVPPPSARIFDPLRQGRRLRVLLAYLHYDYGIRRRGISYETTAFRDPLYHLGCDVVEAPLDVWKHRLGASGAASCLLETAFRGEPDVVLVIPFGDEVQPATLAELRDGLKSPVLAWFCDDHWRFDGYTRHFLPAISVAITTSRDALPRYQHAGFARVIRSQWSANHRIFRPLGRELRYDLSFIGQPHSDRPLLVKRLRSAGLSVITRGSAGPRAGCRCERWSRSPTRAGSVSISATPRVVGRTR